MNFVSGTIEKNDNCYKFIFGQHHLTLPKRMQENSKLEQHVGKKVVLGVRPENLNVDSSLINEDKSNKLTIHVELAEMIGAETYLHSSINNEKAISSVPSNLKIESGRDVEVYIDTRHIHLFDQETEQLICD